jgi:hypothetical protein
VHLTVSVEVRGGERSVDAGRRDEGDCERDDPTQAENLTCSSYASRQRL